MSKNKIYDDGNLIPITAPYAVSSGGGVLVGGLFGVAEVDIASGAVGIIDTEGVFDLAKATGSGKDFDQGERVYWDNSAKVVTPTSAGNTEVGVAIAAATTTATTARVRLWGFTLPVGA